ncbi:membrane-associated protein, putative [Bodo saltans]|uniref:Membrane-associated protein, putative n=1 Tax=Bodo saltans TaxID=75058 RepID=A0A0S4KKS1_BODSA|nr:membrane-associated protein, putative [Bodo saltans]|eukprot:CUI14227.1 membrane-associated protein, putative [Bodo saltans]
MFLSCSRCAGAFMPILFLFVWHLFASPCCNPGCLPSLARTTNTTAKDNINRTACVFFHPKENFIVLMSFVPIPLRLLSFFDHIFQRVLDYRTNSLHDVMFLLFFLNT